MNTRPLMNTRLRRVAVCAILLPWFTARAIPGAPAALPPPVPVTDLGTLGGSASAGFGVNNAGQVVGTSRMPGDKTVHAFFYADGKMTDLGTLGGDQSEALALNDAGQVTGYADIKAKPRRHAFLWQQGHMRDLGTSRADSSTGVAINRAGKVVGQIIRGETSAARACTWSNGKVETLDTSTDVGSSESDGINNNGQVAGSQREPGRPFKDPQAYGTYFADHAVLWRGHKSSELGVPGTEVSLANGLNDSGQIVGAATFHPDRVLHACLWQNGRMIDLGTLAGQETVVYATNRAGLMVGGTNPDDLFENGEALGGPDKPQDAFCCAGSGGRLVDLNSLIDASSGWALTDARSISDTGYVTGRGIYNGQFHAYLLKLPPVL